MYTVLSGEYGTGWRRPTECHQSQVIFCNRATDYRALLRKMTYKDKASYGSSPPCICRAIQTKEENSPNKKNDARSGHVKKRITCENTFKIQRPANKPHILHHRQQKWRLLKNDAYSRGTCNGGCIYRCQHLHILTQDIFLFIHINILL